MSSTSSMNPQTPTTRSPPLPPPLPYSNNHDDDNNNDDDDFRDIHALTPTSQPVPPSRQRMFDANSRRSRSSNLSVASDITNSSENFTTMSREFNALVIAGSTIDHNDYSTNNNHVSGNNGYGYGSGNGNGSDWNNNINLDRIGEEEGETEETNPLAIVPDINPLPSPPGGQGNRNDSSLGHLMGSSSRSTNNNSNSNSSYSNNNSGGEIAIHHVKKEEVETKIAAWQTAKISKINNRFKREDAIISGWENEQLHKATSWMKKIERKLEEKRAKAMEKTQNNIAKAQRKAEERRASAEGKRGTKVARVLEVANLMRAVGKPPAKRSFF